MEKSPQQENLKNQRRQRLHELLIALIGQQDDLELLDEALQRLDTGTISSLGDDPARLLDRNKRILNRYQSLVRSAITLDALLDCEESIATKNN